MPSSDFTLAPPRQLRLAGITVGVLAIRPDPAQREAMVGVFNPDTGQPETHHMRPGDQVTVAGRDVRVRDITFEGRPEVALTVTWPDSPE